MSVCLCVLLKKCYSFFKDKMSYETNSFSDLNKDMLHNVPSSIYSVYRNRVYVTITQFYTRQ